VISSATLQHMIGQKTQRGVYDLTQRTCNVGLHRHSLEWVRATDKRKGVSCSCSFQVFFSSIMLRKGSADMLHS